MFKIEDSLVIAVDFQVRLMPAMHNCEEVEKKAEMFVKGCRLLGVPILVTQQYTKGLGDTLPSIKEALGEFEHIEKTAFSCLRDEGFAKKLKESGKKNIIVAGIESHVCVQQTVLDLLDSEYNVYVIADCISSRSEVDHKYAEERMRQVGAVLTTAEAVLFEFLLGAEHPKRKGVSELVK